MSDEIKTGTQALFKHLEREINSEYERAIFDSYKYGVGYLKITRDEPLFRHVTYEELYEHVNFVRGLEGEDKP